MAQKRQTLPPGAKWIELPSGKKRVELVVDIGADPATGKRRQIRRRLKDANEAINEYAKIKREVGEGTYVARSVATVENVCADWLAGRRLGTGTIANYSNSLKPVRRAYGALPIQSLTKRHVDDLITRLQTGKMPRSDGKPSRKWKASTINLLLTVLGMVLEDAQRQGLVVRNVARLVDRVPVDAEEMQTYTPAEIRKVLRHARTDRLEHAWHLALTGLRRGEVCGLMWSDIDFTKKTITIQRARVSVDGEVVVVPPKTERGRRTLPLSEELIKVLRRAKRRQAAEKLKAGEPYHDSGYLVRNEIGQPLHPETVSDYWDRLIAGTKVRRIRLHDARHTCGTLLHLQGVKAAVIAAWLGHANAAFTMKTYVHSQDEALIEAARMLGVVTGR